jgi:hypothetical protein
MQRPEGLQSKNGYCEILDDGNTASGFLALQLEAFS